MKVGPSGSAIRSLIPSHRGPLWSKATVVSAAETSGRRGVGEIIGSLCPLALTPVSPRKLARRARLISAPLRSTRSIDLHQGFSSLPSRSSDAHSCERFGPQLANLGMTPFKGEADGIAERHEVRALQQHDLRLQQASALEFDAARVEISLFSEPACSCIWPLAPDTASPVSPWLRCLMTSAVARWSAYCATFPRPTFQ
jgi:hypothetical protein